MVRIIKSKLFECLMNLTICGFILGKSEFIIQVKLFVVEPLFLSGWLLAQLIVILTKPVQMYKK